MKRGGTNKRVQRKAILTQHLIPNIAKHLHARNCRFSCDLPIVLATNDSLSSTSDEEHTLSEDATLDRENFTVSEHL